MDTLFTMLIKHHQTPIRTKTLATLTVLQEDTAMKPPSQTFLAGSYHLQPDKVEIFNETT